MAEAVLRHMAASREFAIDVDSAGVAGYHIGESPHRLTLKTLAKHGVAPPGLARRVSALDFQEFDHLVAMDSGHKTDLCAWPGAVVAKVSLLHDWRPDLVPYDVPDPYYGAEPQYERVYEIVSIGAAAILDRLAHGLS